MKIKNLIAKLSELDPEMEIVLPPDGSGYNMYCQNIYLNKIKARINGAYVH